MVTFKQGTFSNRKYISKYLLSMPIWIIMQTLQNSVFNYQIVVIGGIGKG